MNIVRKCLDQCKNRNQITIKMNPMDLGIAESRISTVKSMLGQDCRVVYLSDDSIMRGGAIIETEAGKIDARIETQLGILSEALGRGKGTCVTRHASRVEGNCREERTCHCEERSDAAIS